MHVAHELLPAFPFAYPSAVRILLFPQNSADNFPSPLSEVYNQSKVRMGRSELIYRYCNEMPCARLVRSCRWSWHSPFWVFQRLAPYAATSLLLSSSFRAVNSLKKFASARCLPQYKFIRKRAHRGFLFSSHSASQRETRASRNFRKAFMSAPRLVTSHKASRFSFIHAFQLPDFFLAFSITDSR
jgi:hypothetical protein